MNQLKNREKITSLVDFYGVAEISGVSNLPICLLNPHAYSPYLL